MQQNKIPLKAGLTEGPWDAVGEDSDREGVIAFVERSWHLGPQEQSIESGELGDDIFYLKQDCHRYIHITFTSNRL